MRNGITMQIYILMKRRQLQVDMEEGRKGQEMPEGKWMDLACSQKCFQVRLKIRSTGSAYCPVFWMYSQQMAYFLLEQVEWQFLLGHQKSPHGGTRSSKSSAGRWTQACFTININSFIFKLAIK